MKMCTAILVIREIQVKTKVRCHFTPSVITIILKWKAADSGKNVEKLAPFYTGGNAYWCGFFGNKFGNAEISLTQLTSL